MWSNMWSGGFFDHLGLRGKCLHRRRIKGLRSRYFPARRRSDPLPNLSGKLFLLVYSGFQPFSICFTYSLTLLSPLFPGVPAPSVVIYVVKNASHPVSGEDSPVPDGKRFAFQIVCIVTLRRELCKRFLKGMRLKG